MHSIEWETPPILFAKLHEEFDFTLDACASHRNHKIDNYFTKKDDALTKPWHGRVWINPPYERGRLMEWVEKIIEEIESGRAEVVVALLPDYNQPVNKVCWMNAAGVRRINQNVTFYQHGKPYNNHARYTSTVYVFHQERPPAPVVTWIDSEDQSTDEWEEGTSETTEEMSEDEEDTVECLIDNEETHK
jgi:hypothetical protein